jgi:hypothetical protein
MWLRRLGRLGRLLWRMWLRRLGRLGLVNRLPSFIFDFYDIFILA